MGVKLNDYEQKLLEGWEDVYKKGQLTIWTMLALKDKPKHMAEIKEFIKKSTHGVLSADDQSMYRALRRYNDAELINFVSEPGEGGPDRKVYSLTQTGCNILAEFLGRNITAIYYQESVIELIKS